MSRDWKGSEDSDYEHQPDWSWPHVAGASLVVVALFLLLLFGTYLEGKI